MTAGNVTLLEASKWSTSPLTGTVVETLIQESPILADLPMRSNPGDVVRIRVEGDLPTAQFRNLNEGYNPQYASDTKVPFGVAIMGTEIKVDRFLAANYVSPVDAKAAQWRKAIKGASRLFDRTFFDGTGSAASKDFAGLKELIAQGYGQQIATGINGAVISLDHLDALIDLLRTESPDAFYMRRDVKTKIMQVARGVSGGSLLDLGHDALGRRVEQYCGIPLKIVGEDHLNAAILPNNEVQGSASNCSSIYAVRYGADTDLFGIMGLGGSLQVEDFGEIQSAPQHLGRMEWYPGLACANRYSIGRLTGVLVA